MSTPHSPIEATIHAVGRPYEGVRKPTDPGPRYNFRFGYHTLTIFDHSVEDQMVQIYKDAPIRMGFWKDGPVMWAIFNVQGLGWQDAPYTPHRVEPEGRQFVELPYPESRYPLTIIVGNAEDSVIRTIRSTTLSPEVSRQVRDIAMQLAQESFDEDAFDRKILETYWQYKSSQEMKDLPTFMDVLGQP